MRKNDCKQIAINTEISLRCPSEGCGSVLISMAAGFENTALMKRTCRNCGTEAGLCAILTSNRYEGMLVTLYSCASCLVGFGIRQPAIKRYCKSCKASVYMYLELPRVLFDAA